VLCVTVPLIELHPKKQTQLLTVLEENFVNFAFILLYFRYLLLYELTLEYYSSDSNWGFEPQVVQFVALVYVTLRSSVIIILSLSKVESN
jgi:hypothetical protein